MKNIAKTGLILLFILLLTNCTDLLGELNNPADPKSDSYEGVYTAETSEIQEIPSKSVFCPQIKAAKVFDAIGYDLQVSKDEDFNIIVINVQNQLGNVFDTGYILLPEGYYWCRVRARKTGGDGNWSESKTFDIINPSISGPEEGSEFYDETPELFWDDIDGAQSYEVSYSENDDFFSTSTVSSIYNRVSLSLPTGTWFWRYRAINGLDEKSPWSDCRSLSVINLPPNPVTDFTAEEGQDNTVLNWTKPDIDDLVGYEITISPAVTGITQPISISEEETEYFLTGLITNTNYSVSIKAVDTSDQRSNSSTIQVVPRSYNSPIYEISYSENGATSGTAPISQPKFLGTDVILASNTGNLAKDGYTFVGWDTQAYGTGKHYTENSIYTTNENLSLYAKWEKYHTLNFDPNGGTGSMPDLQINEGDIVTLPSNSFKKEGYVFVGWSTLSNGSVEYSDSTEFSMGSGDVTLFAQWTEYSHKISFHANGGIGSMSDQIIPYDTTEKLKANIFTKTDSKFLGWSTSFDGDVEFSDESQFTMSTSDVVLYAIWGPLSVIGIEAGRSNSFVIKEDSTLWGTGYNIVGQLGDGTTDNTSVLVKIFDNVKTVCVSESSTFILCNDGKLWATGYNSFGNLGDGTFIQKTEPVWIMDNVRSISAGRYHCLIIKNDNTLWGTGRNDYGQLGDGTKENKGSPVFIMDNVQTASCGMMNSMILKRDGTLWGVGVNLYGEFGIGIKSNTTIPVELLDKVKSVVSGDYHTLIIKEDDSLWASGNNLNGQLGNGTDVSELTFIKIRNNIKSASARMNTTVFIDNSNTLWGCGSNRVGQLGDGANEKQLYPLQIMNEIKAYSLGYGHSLFQKMDDSIWATGENTYGSYGNGTTESSRSPILMEY